MSPRAAPLALALALTAAAAPARADWYHRLVVRGELAGGTMLSYFQRTELGYGALAHGTVRVGYNLANALSLQLSVGQWFFFSGQGNGAVVPVTLGARLEPRILGASRLFFEGNGGVSFTGPVARLGFDLAVGFELAAFRWFAFGPVIRYGHVRAVPELDAQGDAQFLSFGLSISLRIPEPEALPTPAPPPLPSRPTPTPEPPASVIAPTPAGSTAPPAGSTAPPAGSTPAPANAAAPPAASR